MSKSKLNEQTLIMVSLRIPLSHSKLSSVGIAIDTSAPPVNTWKMTILVIILSILLFSSSAVVVGAFRVPPSNLFNKLCSSRLNYNAPTTLLHSSTTTPNESTTNNNNDNDMKLEQKIWMFNDKYPISYEVASNSNLVTNNNNNGEIVPILLLNGFGVGSFHQHRLMKQLLLEQKKHQDTIDNKQYVIYGIDYLGQGNSWPTNCNDGDSKDELNLGYSADMWLDQLTEFIQEVIIPISSNKKVHLAGNSVGGYLATILTSRHPELISSLILMNATPVWGLNLPGWDGKLPAPTIPKLVGRKLFDTIRDDDTIAWYLNEAYVHAEAFDGTSFQDYETSDQTINEKNQALGSKIKACTENNGGHAAFSSILWSAPASESSEKEDIADFYSTLGKLPVDVLLLFGENDTWCTPAVAKRMHINLASRSDTTSSPAVAATQRYVSLLNSGHCPNHESPTAVARVLLPWINSQDRSNVQLVSDSNAIIKEPWSTDISAHEVTIEESNNMGIMDRIVSTLAS